MADNDSSPCQAPPGHWGEDVTAPTAVSPVSLALLVLKTSRLDETRAFYDRLGVVFEREQHGTGPVHYAGRIGDAVLELYPAAAGEESIVRLGFAVTGLKRVTAALAGGGDQVVTPPATSPWGLRAVVRDPDGRAVELYERNAPPG